MPAHWLVFLLTFVKCPWSIFYLRHFKLNFFTLHYTRIVQVFCVSLVGSCNFTVLFYLIANGRCALFGEAMLLEIQLEIFLSQQAACLVVCVECRAFCGRTTSLK